MCPISLFNPSASTSCLPYSFLSTQLQLNKCSFTTVFTVLHVSRQFYFARPLALLDTTVNLHPLVHLHLSMKIRMDNSYDLRSSSFLPRALLLKLCVQPLCPRLEMTHFTRRHRTHIKLNMMKQYDKLNGLLRSFVSNKRPASCSKTVCFLNRLPFSFSNSSFKNPYHARHQFNTVALHFDHRTMIRHYRKLCLDVIHQCSKLL